MSRSIVITGMHRSGTSLLANALGRAGVDLGDQLVTAGRGNRHGHFEDVEFLQFHERFLGRRGIGALAPPADWQPRATPAEEGAARQLVARRIPCGASRTRGARSSWTSGAPSCPRPASSSSTGIRWRSLCRSCAAASTSRCSSIPGPPSAPGRSTTPGSSPSIAPTPAAAGVGAMEGEEPGVVDLPGAEGGPGIELHLEVDAAAQERQSDLHRMPVDEEEAGRGQEGAPEVQEERAPRVLEAPQGMRRATSWRAAPSSAGVARGCQSAGGARAPIPRRPRKRSWNCRNSTSSKWPCRLPRPAVTSWSPRSTPARPRAFARSEVPERCIPVMTMLRDILATWNGATLYQKTGGPVYVRRRVSAPAPAARSRRRPRGSPP